MGETEGVRTLTNVAGINLNIKKLHHDVLDTIELVTKKKMKFDWKTSKKSTDAVDKAITTYEHADHSANNELYGIQSVFRDLLLKQVIVIKPANSLPDII